MTRAMTAPAIMEVFIEPKQIRIELEIGAGELEAFQNLLPDKLLARIGLEAPPLRNRFPRFLLEDLTVRLDGGKPLPALVEKMEARKRLRRDEITGVPLPAQGDEENVVFASLVYPFEGTPRTLSIKPPGLNTGRSMASIGFTTYHLGLPIMDFRYLGQEETAELDWDDPWYSRFQNRNLRRQYDAPINAFLYVEPYEVRVEIILRPLDLQQWVDLGLNGAATIPMAGQEELERKVAAFLADHINLEVDGAQARPVLDRIHFLRRTLRTSTVIDPREELSVHSATLGAIFILDTAGLPQTATLTWDLFSEKYPVVRAAATDEAGPMPYLLKPADNVLHWQNFLKRPTIPQLLPVAAPPPAWMQPARTAGWVLCGIMTVGFLAVVRGRLAGSGKRTQGFLLLLALVCLLGVSLALTREVAPRREQVQPTVGNLLRNIYHAFDFRDEGTVYDVLAQSVTGDLLKDVYLETRKGLELASQGGAKVKVKELDVLQVTPRPLRGQAGFLAHCRWNVIGSVGHWGHIHQRTNQYEAELTIRPVDAHWKITGLELLREERVN